MKAPFASALLAAGLSFAGAALADEPLCPPGTVAIVKGNTVHCITIERKEEPMKGRKTTTTKLFEASAAPYERMRYATVGDWILSRRVRSSGTIHISVARLPDPRYEFLVALHELIEARLCQQRGIAQAAVDEWDMRHQDADEPGEIPGSPYYREHHFALVLERMMARELGVDWQNYEEAIKELGK